MAPQAEGLEDRFDIAVELCLDACRGRKFGGVKLGGGDRQLEQKANDDRDRVFRVACSVLRAHALIKHPRVHI